MATYSSGGFLAPDEEVHEETAATDNGWIEAAGLKEEYDVMARHDGNSTVFTEATALTIRAALFHFRPFRVLYSRPAWKPATTL